MALTVSARSRFTLPSTPALVRGAGLSAALGIGLSYTADYADFGRWITVAGVLLLIFSLHRFGRSGPDPAIVFELAPPRKKKKKKRKASTEAAAPEEPVGADAESDSAGSEPAPEDE